MGSSAVMLVLSTLANGHAVATTHLAGTLTMAIIAGIKHLTISRGQMCTARTT